MTDPISLPFEMNQGQLTEAIAAAMPGLIADLAMKFTNGRESLTAQVVVSEEQIRQAVTEHAKRLVNPQFRYFDISFKATRGEDGMTTSILASTHPIAQSETSATQTATATAVPAETRKPSPLKEPEPATTAAVEPEPETVSEGEASASAEVAPADVVEEEQAPWSEGDEAVSEAAVVTEPAPVETSAVADEATATEEAKPAPAAGRSRLFADLQRPTN